MSLAPGLISPDLARIIHRMEALRRERHLREAIARAEGSVGRRLTRAEKRGFRKAVFG